VIVPDAFPPTWRFCLVKEAGETLVGQQRSPETTSGAADDRRNYLRVANVRDDALDLQDLATMSFDADAQQKYRLLEGDILLCEGQSRELVGRAAMYRSEPEELYFQNTLIRFRARHEILPEFALLVFRAYQHSGVFAEIAKATTNIAHLGLRRFQELPFPLPPRITQEAIIDCARDIQSSIDAALTAMGAITDEATELPGAARDLLILEGADLGNPGESDPHKRVLWQQAADVVAENAPIVYGILQPGPDVDDGSGVPYVRGQDLQDGFILQNQLRRTSPSIAQRYERSSLKAGDVLLGIIRSLRVAVVPPELSGANITQGTARIRPNDQVDSDYLAHWLSSSAAQGWLRSRLRGIDMPGLNLRDVRQLPVPVRDMNTQRQIAEALTEVTSAHQSVIKDARSAVGRLLELERELTVSCAYGEMARRITQETAADKAESLSSLILTEIREAAVKQQRKPSTRSSQSAKNRSKRISLKPAVTPEEVLVVLQEASGPLDPEHLFRQLSLSDSAVDSFYAALRDLKQSRKLKITRPNDTDVQISVAD
jgi:hypothetical protein